MHQLLARVLLQPQRRHPEPNPSALTDEGGRTLHVLAWPAASMRPNGREGNPYPRLLYDGLANSGIQVANFHWARLLLRHWHIWHMHWPDGIIAGNRPSWVRLLKIAVFWFLIRLGRLRGTRIIWTAHNVKPHDSAHPRLEGWFFAMLTANLAAVICLSRSAQGLLRQQYPRTREIPVYVVPHGHFGGCYPDAISRPEARQKLELGSEELVFLFIGQLRRYKNVIRLIECFRDAAHQDWRLVVAGEPRDTKLEAEVAALASTCSQVTLLLEFIPNDQLQVYLRASDLVVLPYMEILNSGAAILALSFGRPVLVPARGALVDLREDVGHEWVMTYEHELTPETLRLAAAWARLPRPERPPLGSFDWEPIRDTTAAIFREVAHGQPAEAFPLRCS